MRRQSGAGEVFQEPAETGLAGHRDFSLAQTPYDRFMDEQEIPVYRGNGLHDVRELPLAPWERMGGRASFIQLLGTEGLWGMYVVEVPAAGALMPERHIYEELFFVVEGRGSTEVWREGSPRKQTFEWQAGSLFAVPLNAWHRLVNASSGPALLVAANLAPPVLDLYENQRFVFDNPFEFTDRYDDREDYFRPSDEIVPDPVAGRAMVRASLLPDIVNCELPLDNQRSPGYRRLEPQLAGGKFFAFIGQHETGRYTKAHHHRSGAVLICLSGKGYTYNWPKPLGLRPWETGNEQFVERYDYGPGGMVAAAPGGGDWFHQHFGVAREPLRLLALLGTKQSRGFYFGRPGQQAKSPNLDVDEGGNSIGYPDEDPHIREEFKRMLRLEGAECRMPDELYR